MQSAKLWLIDLRLRHRIRLEDVKSSPSPTFTQPDRHVVRGGCFRSFPAQTPWGRSALVWIIRRTIPESHPLHRLFRGLTEYAFMNKLGIGDPSLVGYVAELLASFVPSGQVWQLRNAQGKRLFQVTAMIAEAEAAGDDARRRECHRHVGDFTLFWTGVYPEALAKLQGSDSANALINYQRQGKRSYHLASVLSTATIARPFSGDLSEQFELCAVGLSHVRREWEKIELEGPSGGGSRPVVV